MTSQGTVHGRFERAIRRRRALEFGHTRSDGFLFSTLTGAPMSARNAATHADSTRAPRLRDSTLRIRSGADPVQVQRFAGHAKPSITLDLYAYEFEGRKVNDSGDALQRSTEACSK